ncbi:MAG: dihydroneopterin aldolase, partial [Clostridiales bacterium]|nr:dihydroneopterin aldolase [Clostridiales bacterium]
MDRINITGLEVFAHHGVYREENVLGQKFIVDVSMMVSTKEAGRTDDIRRSVNYGLV